jgi:hypothetical protein
MVFRGNLQQRGKGCRVCVDLVPYPIRNLWPSALLSNKYRTHMLVYQQDGNVLSLLGEPVEGLLDGSRLRLVVDHQEVLLRVGSRCNMLWRVSYCNLAPSSGPLRRFQPATAQSRSPVQRQCAPPYARSDDRTSSPMTARNCLSLYAAAGAAIFEFHTGFDC